MQVFKTLDTGGVKDVIHMELEPLKTDDLGLRVHYVKDIRAANEICEKLMSERAVGFDAEWTPQSKQLPGSDGLVATVQISTSEDVWVFHLARMLGGKRGMPTGLKKLLETERVLKAGVNVAGDKSALGKLGVKLAGIEDVAQICFRFGVTSASRSVSLKFLAEVFVGKTLEKDLACSNWDGKRNADQSGNYLDKAQIEYAALDAGLGKYVSDKLNDVRSNLPPTFSPGDRVVAFDASIKKRIALATVKQVDYEPGYSLLEVAREDVMVRSLHLDQIQQTCIGIWGSCGPKNLGVYADSQPQGNFEIPWKTSHCLPKIEIQAPPALGQAMLFDEPMMEEGGGAAAAGAAAGQGQGQGQGGGGGAAAAGAAAGAGQGGGGGAARVAGWMGERVKLDPVHWFMRLGDLISMGHSLRGIFFRHLRDAVFAIPSEEKKEWEAAMREKLEKEGGRTPDEISLLIIKAYEKMLKCTRRVIPPPDDLLAATNKVYALFGHQVDKKTGEPLFDERCWDAVKKGEKHIQNGCLSDLPGLDLYSVSRNKKHLNDEVHCARGTSAIEGWHKHLRRGFQGTSISPANALLLLLGKVHSWNLKIAISRRGEEDYGTHNTALLLRLMDLDEELKQEMESVGKYRMPNPNHFEHNPEERLGLSHKSFLAKGANFVDDDASDCNDDGGQSCQDTDDDDSSSSDEDNDVNITAAEREFNELCRAQHGCGILIPKAPSDDEIDLINHLLTISQDAKEVCKGWQAALKANSKLKGADRKALRFANDQTLTMLMETVAKRKNRKDSLAPFEQAAKELQKVDTTWSLPTCRFFMCMFAYMIKAIYAVHPTALR